MNWDTEGGKPLKSWDEYYKWGEFVANGAFFDHVNHLHPQIILTNCYVS